MKIVVTVGGYGGAGSKSISLAAMRDDATGILSVAKEVKYRESAPEPTPEKPERWAFVTNMRLPNYDCLFTEEHLQAAILAYREGDGMGTFVIDDEVAKYRPRIEVDGIDTNGQKYRLASDITNGEMAVLALAHFQSRQRTVGALTSQMDRMTKMYDILSV
jgi:hypothetical protein